MFVPFALIHRNENWDTPSNGEIDHIVYHEFPVLVRTPGWLGISADSTVVVRELTIILDNPVINLDDIGILNTKIMAQICDLECRQ